MKTYSPVVSLRLNVKIVSPLAVPIKPCALMLTITCTPFEVRVLLAAPENVKSAAFVKA